MGRITDKLSSEKPNADTLSVVKGLLEYGHSEKFICDHLNINYGTWRKWKQEDHEFKELLANWRNYADAQVEKALFERARGGAKKTKRVTKADGSVEETVEELAADPGAAAKWLRCRKPEEWTDKTQVEHTGTCDLRGLIGILDKQESEETLGDLLS